MDNVEKIAQIMWFIDQSCQSEHPTQRHRDSANEVLKTLKELGYRLIPELKGLSDEEIKRLIIIYGWELSPAKEEHIIADFRNISQATVEKNKKQIEDYNK